MKLSFWLFALACLVASSACAKPDTLIYLNVEKGPLVVILTPTNQYGRGATGFEVRGASGETYTITNQHVCMLSTNGLMAAHYNGSERVVYLKVIEISPKTDLCLLEALPAGKGMFLADSLDTTKEIYILGHPRLRPLESTQGKIEGLITEPNYFPFYESDAKVEPGNSGSPVFNAEGDVVGVIFALNVKTQGGLFIPLEAVKDFLSNY